MVRWSVKKRNEVTEEKPFKDYEEDEDSFSSIEEEPFFDISGRRGSSESNE